MRSSRYYVVGAVMLAALLGIVVSSEWGAQGQERAAQPPIKNSYDQISPTLIGNDTFGAVMARDKADKPGVTAPSATTAGGRLLTLEDTIEFFNLILETKLTQDEKVALVAFLRQL